MKIAEDNFIFFDLCEQELFVMFFVVVILYLSHAHHDLGLFNEVLLQHRALFDGFDRHLVLSPPLAKPNLPKVAATQLLHEGQLPGIYLPFFCKAITHR